MNISSSKLSQKTVHVQLIDTGEVYSIGSRYSAVL